MSWLDGRLINALERVLDVAAVQQRMIAENLANVNTPGYKRKEVLFRESLESTVSRSTPVELIRTNPRHLMPTSRRSLEPVVVETRSAIRNDQNNVDLESEMAKLAKNTVYYQATSQAISNRLQLLQYIIEGGR